MRSWSPVTSATPHERKPRQPNEERRRRSEQRMQSDNAARRWVPCVHSHTTPLTWFVTTPVRAARDNPQERDSATKQRLVAALEARARKAKADAAAKQAADAQAHAEAATRKKRVQQEALRQWHHDKVAAQRKAEAAQAARLQAQERAKAQRLEALKARLARKDARLPNSQGIAKRKSKRRGTRQAASRGADAGTDPPQVQREPPDSAVDVPRGANVNSAGDAAPQSDGIGQSSDEDEYGSDEFEAAADDVPPGAGGRGD